MRAVLEALPGIESVTYDPGQDLFAVNYDPALTDPAAIFAAVFLAGKKMGQEYLPKLIT